MLRRFSSAVPPAEKATARQDKAEAAFARMKESPGRAGAF